MWRRQKPREHKFKRISCALGNACQRCERKHELLSQPLAWHGLTSHRGHSRRMLRSSGPFWQQSPSGRKCFGRVLSTHEEFWMKRTWIMETWLCDRLDILTIIFCLSLLISTKTPQIQRAQKTGILTLKGTDLRSIPPEVSELLELRVADLRDNKFVPKAAELVSMFIFWWRLTVHLYGCLSSHISHDVQVGSAQRTCC